MAVRELATIANIGTTIADSTPQGEEWDTEAAWKKVAQRTGITPPLSQKVHPGRSFAKFPGRWYQNTVFRVAASVVLLGGVGLVVQSLLRPSNDSGKFIASYEVNVPNGQQMKLTLPDGTQVTLNSGSAFGYSDKFERVDREVSIAGEAFFDVAKNKGTRFIVYAGSARLVVIGTEFSVKARPEEAEVRLVVREGKVAFSGEHDEREEETVVVRPGEMSTLVNGRISPPRKASLGNELAWLRGELIFEATPFQNVMRSLERRFNIHCVVSDSTILGRRLTATFKDETTDEVLDVIALSLQLQYSRSQDLVTFSMRER